MPLSTELPEEDYANTCPICLVVINYKDKETTSCGHSFHFECINKWLKRNRNNPQCPLCRADLSRDLEQYIEEETLDPNNAPLAVLEREINKYIETTTINILDDSKSQELRRIIMELSAATHQLFRDFNRTEMARITVNAYSVNPEGFLYNEALENYRAASVEYFNTRQLISEKTVNFNSFLRTNSIEPPPGYEPPNYFFYQDIFEMIYPGL